MALKIGQKAPDWSGLNQNGQLHFVKGIFREKDNFCFSILKQIPRNYTGGGL